MLKKQNLGTSTNNFATAASSSGTANGMHKNSQIIAKVKPKIRIIHIFAPEIIKTDAANFRELVQRLTGKPTENKKNSSMISKKRPRNSTSILPSKRVDQSPSPSSSSSISFSTATNSFTTHHLHHHQHHPMMIHMPFASKMELKCGFLTSAEFREKIKGEEEIWRNANSGGGFLGGFAELEGFMEQLNHEYPLLPTMPVEAAHHHMDAYGQSQLA